MMKDETIRAINGLTGYSINVKTFQTVVWSCVFARRYNKIPNKIIPFFFRHWQASLRINSWLFKTVSEDIVVFSIGVLITFRL